MAAGTLKASWSTRREHCRRAYRQAPPESRPEFPYIEADHGRINFKFGPEKKPFAVTDAEYAFWQDSDNTWGMRLKGQPVRTDFNLSDTGQLKVNGTWQRASRCRRRRSFSIFTGTERS